MPETKRVLVIDIGVGGFGYVSRLLQQNPAMDMAASPKGLDARLVVKALAIFMKLELWKCDEGWVR